MNSIRKNWILLSSKDYYYEFVIGIWNQKSFNICWQFTPYLYLGTWAYPLYGIFSFGLNTVLLRRGVRFYCSLYKVNKTKI